MKKIIFILTLVVFLGVISTSCRRPDISVPLIQMDQVTPDNAMDYVNQFGCKQLPNMIDQWDWESVHHAGSPVSTISNQGALQTIEFTADSCFYPNLTGTLYNYLSSEWTHLDCSIVSGVNASQNVWVHVVADDMIMIGTSDLTVWRLSRN